MIRSLAVTRLHLNKREMVFGVPFFVYLSVVAVSMIVAIAMARFGLDMDSPEVIQGFRNNGGAVWSITGFFVYLGVQAVATTFPFGMSMGTTRRAYSAGTALYFGVQSIYAGLIAVTLCSIEKLTNQWFVGAYVFDVAIFGTDNYLRVGLLTATITFVALSIGGAFGSLFVKAGSKGPIIGAIVLVFVLVAGVALAAPAIPEWIADATWVSGVVGGVLVGAIALAAQYFALRRASVR
ncbi:hypothetical protein [Jonesia quinghaiensis]|uniref:hypothetical protein n=1 Tax=Jonesia quinghaiensis TaxID=262806 RepID=UPI0003FE9B44|nr:hypothetical protein [Jonesia quinghaiensis]